MTTGNSSRTANHDGHCITIYFVLKFGITRIFIVEYTQRNNYYWQKNFRLPYIYSKKFENQNLTVDLW